MEVKVFGQNFGTASGWDEAYDFAVQFYNFEPNTEVKQRFNLECCSCIVFDFIQGFAECYEDSVPVRVDFGLKLK